MGLQRLAAPFAGVGKDGAEMNTQGAMGDEGTRGVSLKYKPNGPDLTLEKPPQSSELYKFVGEIKAQFVNNVHIQ